MKSYRLVAIIVNYRTARLSERALDALAPMLERADACAVVVDNNSQDGSFERLSDYCRQSPHADRLTLIQAGRNGGFSAGNNAGMAAVKADYVLLLNSDAVIAEGALEALLAAGDAAPRAGIVAPRIVSSAGDEEVSRFRNHSPLSEFLDGAKTGPLTRLLRFAETPIYAGDWTSRPDWVSFAAVLLKREAIEKAGPMDEGFFLYYEDCDYCRRIKAAGFEIAMARNAVFVHDPGGSTRLREREAAKERLPRYYYVSRARYFRKYYGPAGPLIANLAWMAGRAIALMRALFGRPAPALCEKRAADIWIGWAGGETSANAP